MTSWNAEVRAHDGLTGRWEVLLVPSADDDRVELQHRYVQNWEDLETLLATAGLRLDDVLWGDGASSYRDMVAELGEPVPPVGSPKAGGLDITWPRTQVDR